MTARRTIAIIIGSILVLVAASTLLWSTVTTSTAQISASTSGSGFFTAGTVELERPETTVALLFDADGLYPGRVVSSCVTVAYNGSLPADIRLHGSWSGGTGLEEHVELRLIASEAGPCGDGDDRVVDPGTGSDVGAGAITPSAQSVFVGLLADLWRSHPDYGHGLILATGANRGDRVVLHAEVEMVDGDEAQGLTTEFAIVIEARP